MLVRQENQKSAIFVTIGIFQMNAIDAMISTLNIKGADYCCIISGISKSEAIKLMQNNYLTEKSGTL